MSFSNFVNRLFKGYEEQDINFEHHEAYKIVEIRPLKENRTLLNIEMINPSSSKRKTDTLVLDEKEMPKDLKHGDVLFLKDKFGFYDFATRVAFDGDVSSKFKRIKKDRLSFFDGEAKAKLRHYVLDSEDSWFVAGKYYKGVGQCLYKKGNEDDSIVLVDHKPFEEGGLVVGSYDKGFQTAIRKETLVSRIGLAKRILKA